MYMYVYMYTCIDTVIRYVIENPYIPWAKFGSKVW